MSHPLKRNLAVVLFLATSLESPLMGGENVSNARPDKWAGLKAGSWVQYAWRYQFEDGSSDAYTVKMTVEKIDEHLVWFTITNSKGQTFQQGETRKRGMNGGLSRSEEEENVVREEAIAFRDRQIPCEVIERITRTYPWCGNDPLKHSEVIETRWVCRLDGEERVLRKSSRASFAYRDGTTRELPSSSAELQQFDVPVKLKGKTYACDVVLEKEPAGELTKETRAWLCTGLPGGFYKKTSTGAGSKIGEKRVASVETTLVDFER